MEIKRLFDLLDRLENKFSKEKFLNIKKNKKWINFSTKDYVENSNNISLGLLSLGVKKGDKISIISANRPEWNFVDMGILQTGAINVPIYPTISEQEYKFILNHAEVKFIFVSDNNIYRKLKHIVSDVNSLVEIYSFDEIEGVKHYNEVLKLGDKNKS